jgi:hypothetical protein
MMEGGVRLRTLRGWISATSNSGSILAIREGNANLHYLVNYPCRATNSVELSDTTVSTPVPKNAVVEVLESATASTGEARHRITAGWISEIDGNISKPMNIYCSVEVLPEGCGRSLLLF